MLSNEFVKWYSSKYIEVAKYIPRVLRSYDLVVTYIMRYLLISVSTLGTFGLLFKAKPFEAKKTLPFLSIPSLVRLPRSTQKHFAHGSLAKGYADSFDSNMLEYRGLNFYQLICINILIYIPRLREPCPSYRFRNLRNTFCPLTNKPNKLRLSRRVRGVK